MKKSIAIIGLMACAPLVSAEGLSYNYAQVNWIADSELESGGSVDGDGFDIGGVFSINEMLYIVGEFKDLSYDGGLEVQEISAGVGAHNNQFTGAIDVFGNLTIESIELSIPGANSDDEGFGLEIGARTALTPELDGYISFDYSDVGDTSGSFFKLGGSWAFNPNWAVVAEYSTGEYEDDKNNVELDRNDMRIGARFNF